MAFLVSHKEEKGKIPTRSNESHHGSHDSSEIVMDQDNISLAVGHSLVYGPLVRISITVPIQPKRGSVG